jgi:hypothetical protein
MAGMGEVIFSDVTGAKGRRGFGSDEGGSCLGGLISPTYGSVGSAHAIFTSHRRPPPPLLAVPHAITGPATAPAPAGMRCRPGFGEPDHPVTIENRARGNAGAGGKDRLVLPDTRNRKEGCRDY